MTTATPTAPDRVAAAPRSAMLAAADERSFSDRTNPILVKELRSALRGRYFRFLFPITLLAATVVAVMIIANDGSSSSRGMLGSPLIAYHSNTLGRDLFQGMFGTLLAAVTGLVPFSAFLSMGNEWDENTYDLLVISKLKPRQIVLGKLFSASVEGLLYFSAFTPFLVFAFLLRGIDITSIVLLLGGAVIASASTIAIALLLSSVGRIRAVRVVLMALLAAILFGANIGANVFVDDYVSSPPAMNTVEHWQILSITYALIALPGVLALAAASSTLAHAEENASTAPRVLVTGLLVVLLAICVWSHVVNPSRDGPFVMGMLLLTFAGLCDLFFVSEAERFTRRVRTLVPRGGGRALLSAPFLPGGGRGLLLYLVHFGLVLLATVLMHFFAGTHGSGRPARMDDSVTAVAVFGSFVLVYLALPSLLAARASTSARARLLTRVLIPLFALLSIFLPLFAGFLMDNDNWVDMKHPFNLIWVAVKSGPDGNDALEWGVAAILAGLFVILLNLPRIVRALTETRSAGVEREQRDARSGAPAELLDAA